MTSSVMRKSSHLLRDIEDFVSRLGGNIEKEVAERDLELNLEFEQKYLNYMVLSDDEDNISNKSLDDGLELLDEDAINSKGTSNCESQWEDISKVEPVMEEMPMEMPNLKESIRQSHYPPCPPPRKVTLGKSYVEDEDSYLDDWTLDLPSSEPRKSVKRSKKSDTVSDKGVMSALRLRVGNDGRVLLPASTSMPIDFKDLTKKRWPFKVGDIVETISFIDGYRGAWFKCKVLKVGISGSHMRDEREPSSSFHRFCLYVEYMDYIMEGEEGKENPKYLQEDCELYGQDPFCVHDQTVGLKNNRSWQLKIRPYPPESITGINIYRGKNWALGDKVEFPHSDCYWVGVITGFHDAFSAIVACPLYPYCDGSTNNVCSFANLRLATEWNNGEWSFLKEVKGMGTSIPKVLNNDVHNDQSPVGNEPQLAQSPRHENLGVSSPTFIDRKETQPHSGVYKWKSAAQVTVTRYHP